MTQIQNRAINQFLQSKSNHSNYNSSLKSTNITEPYFNKNLFTKTSTRIAPHFENMQEEDIYNDNKLKTSYKKNLGNNNKIYYSINNHNHSEFLSKKNSKNNPKIIMNRRGNLRTQEVKKKTSFENIHGYYNKTEDNNAIKRAMSSTYKSGNDETPNNKNNQKKYYSNRKEKRIEIIQSSPSEPLLFKDNDIEENNDIKNDLIIKKKYMEKTFNSRRRKNPSEFNEKLEDIILNNSISNINSDTETRNKIKNYKSTNIIKKKDIYVDKPIHIKENNVSDNNLDIKDNIKYHSIIVKKNRIDKNKIHIDLKQKDNFYTNREYSNNIEKISDNILNQRKSSSPKIIKTNKNITYSSILVENRKNEMNELISNYHNNSLFESKNIKQKDLQDQNNKNNNINTFIDSKIVLLKKLNLNNTLKSVDEKDNKNSILNGTEYMNIDINVDSTNNKMFNSYKIDQKEKNNITYGYDSDISEKPKNKTNEIDEKIYKNKTNYMKEEKKMNYIYEGRSKKQKSLIEESPIPNKYLGKEKEKKEELNNKNSNNNNSNLDEIVKKNLGNVIKKIIKNNPININKNKKINISDNISISDKDQLTEIKSNYFKVEAKYNNNKEKKERQIKKSNSNFMIENKEFSIKKKEINNQEANIGNYNIMEICKVNDITYKGNKSNAQEDNNKTSNKLNNNIIIIINNADKNKFKKVTKTPKISKNKNNNIDNFSKNNNHNKNNQINNNKNLSSDISVKKKNNNNKSINNNIKNHNSNKSNTDSKTINNGINKYNKNNNIKFKKDNNNENNNINSNIDNNINIKNSNIINKQLNKDNNKNTKNNMKEINNKLKINNKRNNNDKKEEKNKSDNFNKIDINNSKEIKNCKNINNNNIYNNNEENEKSEPINSINNNSNLNSSSTKTNSYNESGNIIQDEQESFLQDSIPNINDNINKTVNIKDADNIINNNKIIKTNEFNLDLSKNKEKTSLNIKTETSLINRYNNFLNKKDKEDIISKKINSSQDKKPDFNNNDYTTEETQEIKPVIQHNIQRKRPVYTLPPSKKRSISQGKPFNLIHKYYDENFILEDDEEEEFKKYIKYNGDSRSESEDNNSINSKNSLCNSNKKSNKNLDHFEEEKNNDNENDYDITDRNNNNDETIDINANRREKEKDAFQKITEEFYNDLDEEPF